MAKKNIEVPTTRPWGFKEVVLPKEEYDLDEDGWIWLRSRVTVKMSAEAAKFADTEDIMEWLPPMIANWSLTADGIELPYSPKNCAELPIEILNKIQETLTVPLAEGQGTLPETSEQPDSV
jgi:hypothetical protein